MSRSFTSIIMNETSQHCQFSLLGTYVDRTTDGILVMMNYHPTTFVYIDSSPSLITFVPWFTGPADGSVQATLLVDNDSTPFSVV